MQRIEMRVRNALERIGEREQATGEVGPGVALEFEHHRLGAALDPDFAAHDALDAIVNLAAHHAVMNPKGHADFFTTDDTDGHGFICRKRNGGIPEVGARQGALS